MIIPYFLFQPIRIVLPAVTYNTSQMHVSEIVLLMFHFSSIAYEKYSDVIKNLNNSVDM
jgi:hypothetical protein